jgi:dipeptidyl aminopeptidase/acylaminoacyl peptidase
VLRDRSGKVVLELERADPTALYAAGWTAPDRVVVKAADGVTDIYCDVFKPHDFDPAKKYPVLDEIYPGPHNNATPLRFPQSRGVLVGTAEGAIFAALGFVVVVVDGRGSALRSKSFHDDVRRNGIPLFVDDHAAAIQQLAETRPWMDLDRVGIMGHSSGGSAATTAILARPDVFKVAVASCGNHDNRLNHAWFCEKFWGSTDTFDYGAQSNASLAEKLQGKLFLMHGDMDDNVVVHATMRLVDALIAANKDFDMLIVPNAVHAGVVLNGYWIRKRWDYLVEHLMGEAPPRDYRIADVPLPS